MNNILSYEETTFLFFFSNYIGPSLTWHVSRSVPASIEEGSFAGGGRIFFHRLGSLRQFGNQSNQSREHPAPRGEKTDENRFSYIFFIGKSQLGEARAHQSARLLLDSRFFEYVFICSPDFFYLPFVVEWLLLLLLLVRLMAQLVPLVHSSLETTFLHEKR